MKNTHNPTRIIAMIATVNGIAAILHLVFWVLVFTFLPRPWATRESAERTDLVITYGLGVADLLWSVPFLLVGSFWLYKRLLVGWLAAQMANALYWYSFTVILIREYGAGQIRPGTILFLPFGMFSILAAWKLWKVKFAFWQFAAAA